MILSEIQSIIDLGNTPVEIENISQIDENTISVNHFIPINVIKVNKSYNTANVINLNFDGSTEGFLFFTKQKGAINFDSMTTFEFIAFLNEGEREDYNIDSYEFKNDYVVIKETFWSAYISDYEKTSPLWGGFSHKFNFAEPTTKYLNDILEIEAGSKLKDLDNYSYESTIRAIEQPYAFERFLKLYHLLELQFDYFLIDKIKNLTIPQDSNEIGKLLNDYSRTELDRLTEIISSYCTDINPLISKLELALPFKQISEEIFIKYGNKNKPITAFKFNELFDSNSFSQSNLIDLKIINSNSNPINIFIPKLVSFWIYRIRCSIAHNKIGEYLLSWEDEKFIVEFAEPLMIEVLKQFFKK
ncbi:hypothetical protein J2Q11_01005 [Tenacibaculum finnmarkense genomovar finnmarkense]|uniref:hypothetical protein n=1 Tax=Tenacibaculum finnmarkense TaxID=2781243 RepID=UPI001E297C4C|nr:hypothetical protein [Tenacibaculum finnmarkense]MCD8416994.1 hypothetical protein [Tenacibaculum finnmarkense genomovar finnmarkense]MCG8184613.1 hypothetical protein [Tenacibaculum finnmarkense genomovar finnmarkense]MCG8201927.1 hypothetical protein [Tenacibaculum finnmarkense genomovar finnmarkense]MCG8208681.1 hypothetical protein [Tenacibaculum finnmarkense genomovar finnmarkense]MCG8211412.1 hypothetical protein [Tenacibaculum finnmarkense genomovar finnmarkense]